MANPPVIGDLLGDQPATNGKDFIVCIDFGTYGTAWSWAFANLNPGDQLRVNVEGKWEGLFGDSPKNLSVSLYKHNRCQAIGFKADAMYDNLEAASFGQHSLLDGFKMGLYNNPSAEIEDPATRRKFKVVDVIGQYLASINQAIKERLATVSHRTVDCSTIKYVITVPAVWTEEAKALMRTALVKANIIVDETVPEEDCLFALEPEAACALCVNKHAEVGLPELSDGVVLMVVDAGGGTVDITVHAIENKKLVELTMRNGGPCGSMNIDKNFFKWLSSNFPEPRVIDDMFTQNRIAFKALRKEWEEYKVACNDLTQPKYFQLPDCLKLLVDGGTVPINPGIIIRTPRGSRICVSPEVQQKLFSDAMENVASLVDSQLNSTELSVNVNYLLLVGGFGQCPFLLQRLRQFETDGLVERVLQPPGGITAVVFGGVYLGMDPSLIRLTLSDGIEVEEVFDYAKHEEKRLVMKENKFLCKGVFSPFVRAGDSVDVDSEVRKKYTTLRGEVRITVYYSPKRNNKYVDDPNELLLELGNLVVGEMPSFVEVVFQFGKALFTVEVFDHQRQKCKTAEFVFNTAYSKQ